jgi:phage terminase large subunit-like protein
MYQREAAPKSGDIYIVWDWALSDKKTSDYSVGVVARLYKNDSNEWAFVILEIVYDKWKYSELAFQIVALSKRYGPKVTMIEASNAADMLKGAIAEVGHKFGYNPYIYWKQPSRQENAKRNRIKSVEILLAEHRLHFVLGTWIDETFKQFTQYTGEKKNKGRKDDIPDAVSYLTYILPASARPQIEKTDPEEEKRLQEEQDKYQRKQMQYDRYFGQHLQTNKEAGPVITEVEPPKPLDPRMRIFGNKGPWRL